MEDEDEDLEKLSSDKGDECSDESCQKSTTFIVHSECGTRNGTVRPIDPSTIVNVFDHLV